jgi:hypothetical protein
MGRVVTLAIRETHHCNAGIASYCAAFMESEGFLVYPFEWWHFHYSDWQKYPILNITFEKLASSNSSQLESVTFANSR